ISAAYAAALASRTRPTVLVLPRPGSPKLSGSQVELAAKGGYVIADFPEGLTHRALLVASGQEVGPCIEAQQMLAKDGLAVRVVSLPSWELFEEQPEEYQLSVLGGDPENPKLPQKLPVFFAESAAPLGFERFAGTHLGASGGLADVNGDSLTADAMATRLREALQM
ncbi:unnamed protein product, partial [Polarella glacialis]